MKVVTKPLEVPRNPYLEKVYQAADNGHRAHLALVEAMDNLPTTLDEKVPFLYQLLVGFYMSETEEFADLDHFNHQYFGSSDTDFYSDLYQNLILPFCREIAYRFEEIEEDTIGETQVSSEVIRSNIVNNYHHTTNIQGGVHGGILSTGSGAISNPTINYHTKQEVIQGIVALKEYLTEVQQSQQVAFLDALQLLVKAVDNYNLETKPQAVQTIKTSSAGAFEQLSNIVKGMAMGLISSGSYDVLKHALNIKI